MHSSEFSKLHPLTTVIYFAMLLGAGAFTVQPFFIALSLIGAACFVLRLLGTAALRKLPYLLFPLLIAAGINVLFNHRGVTVLAHFPSGNALTLESLLYGIASGTMLCGVLIWFCCFGKLFTSEKLMCLTGRLFPYLTIVISMTVRFIPLFARRFREIADAQTQLGFGISGVSIGKRLKNLARIFSILISRSLEESVETADSMRCRGYGLSGRSSFSMFRFRKTDALLIAVSVLAGGYVITGEIIGLNEFRFYPRIYCSEASLFSVIQYAAFGVLCFLPFIFELTEDILWRSRLSEI